MIHILIDTSTVKSDLINKERFSTSLERLEILVKDYGAQILFPDSLKEEWEKHKEIEADGIRKKLANENKVLNKLKLQDSFQAQQQWKKHESLILSQISKFDELLNSAVLIEITDEIRLKAVYHFENNLAPFKKKKDSFNDAYSLFSAMEYCDNNRIQELYIVSGDAKDFTDHQKENYRIHQEISDGYSVETRLHVDIRDFFGEIENQFGVQFENDNKYQLSSQSFDSPDIILVDQDQPIGDQLYQLINSELFTTLNFIPHDILLRIVPFKNSERTFFRRFNLETQNKELFDFFSPLGVKEWGTGTDDFKILPSEISKELMSVIKRLRNNTVYFIAKNREYIRISDDETELCNCPTCKVKRLDFTAVSELNPELNSENSINDHLKFAYANYKVDNLKKATDLTVKALGKASEEGHENTIGQFLCYYNLSMLNALIRNTSVYSEFYEQHENILKSSKQRIETMLLESKYGNNYKVFEWMNDNKFYYSSLEKLTKLVQLLRKTHFDSVRGSRSFNSVNQDLIYNYAMGELFVQSNYLMFDEFLEFSNLTKLFAEGMYLSLATEGENSQLSFFNDWTVKTLIKHAKADDLIDFFRISELREVKYESDTSLTEDSAIDMIIRLFRNSSDSVESMNEFGEKSSFFLLQTRHIYNALVLAGQCNFNDKDLIEMINLIPDLLNQRRMRVTIKYVEYFIRRKKHLINTDTFKEIWIAMFKNPELHWGNFSTFATIANCMNDEGLELSLSDEEFNMNISFVTDYCENCKQFHEEFDTLIHLYRILDSNKQKEQLLAVIKEKLNEGELNVRLLELAIVYDLFILSEDFLNKIILDSVKEINRLPEKFSDWETFPILMNICFKYNYNLNSEKFEPLKNLNPFSDWLLDLNNFNYDQFCLEWMFEMRTSYSQNRMRKSQELKAKLEEIISNKNAQYSKRKIDKLEKVYLDIYVVN